MQFADEIETDLRRLIERDFGRASGALSNERVLDWMHYRARRIPCRPRTVVVSQEIAASMADYPAIGRLKAEFQAGKDVSPWQSDRVRKRRDDPLADLMFNDWQISHFHLGNIFVAPNKVGPRPKGELLLFALVKADRVVFLDLHMHGAWTARQILRVLLRTSPQDMPELKGMIPPAKSNLADEELLQLRRAGVTTPIYIDGKAFFPPGLGVSTSRHATRLVRHFNVFSREARNVRQRFENNDLPLHLLRQFAIIGAPVRLGVNLQEDGCLVLSEKARAINLLVMPPLE